MRGSRANNHKPEPRNHRPQATGHDSETNPLPLDLILKDPMHTSVITNEEPPMMTSYQGAWWVGISGTKGLPFWTTDNPRKHCPFQAAFGFQYFLGPFGTIPALKNQAHNRHIRLIPGNEWDQTPRRLPTENSQQNEGNSLT